MKNNFPKRLASLRNQHKLTQQQLAAILNVSKGRIGNYEQGKRSPDIEMLKSLASFFQVTIDYLLGLDDDDDTNM